jgi:SAM-dependent methyltransferase
MQISQMPNQRANLITKAEIAEQLGVPVEKIRQWAFQFPEWLDDDATGKQKRHDADDLAIFALINHIESQIGDDAPDVNRIDAIAMQLHASERARLIRHRRSVEKASPESMRWHIVGGSRSDYEWLAPLSPFVESIADFGCWATDEYATCAEPYALLWSLHATRVVVVDKNPAHINNARKWMDKQRGQEPYFNDYSLEFFVGDLTDRDLIEKVGGLEKDKFDLSYCHRVLYHMMDDSTELQTAIDSMIKVVKPGGWIVAVESTMDVEFLSPYFAAGGLQKTSLRDSPEGAHCFRKPFN